MALGNSCERVIWPSEGRDPQMETTALCHETSDWTGEGTASEGGRPWHSPL